MFNPAKEIFNYYEETNKSRERSESHYPSGVCAEKEDSFIGKCRRAMYYDHMGFAKVNPPNGMALFKMDMGNMIHDKMNEKVDAILEAKYPNSKPVADELPFKYKPDELRLSFSGRIDKVIEWEGKIIGVEWKSTFGRGVTDIKNNGPKEDAFLQSLIYLNQKEHPLDGIILSYIARDSGFIYSYYFHYEDELQCVWLNSGVRTVIDWKFEHVINCLVEFEFCLEKEDLPGRDYNLKYDGRVKQESHWRCRYCDYNTLCGEEE